MLYIFTVCFNISSISSLLVLQNTFSSSFKLLSSIKNGSFWFGGKSVSSLNQAKDWTDPVTHEEVENPLRIDGFARTANNIHVLVSPFAQTEYNANMLHEADFGTKEENSLILKDFPYHIEFCLFNILEMLLFYRIGLRIFKKQDLKW